MRLLDCRSTRNNVDRKFNYFWEAGGAKSWGVKDLLVEGGGGILCQYQDRGGIDPTNQGRGSDNGPVAGLVGIVIEDNTIACRTGRAAIVTRLPNRDYQDASGSWGAIPAAQAQAQYQGPLFRLNRYSGRVTFRVPKAAVEGGSTNIWQWNERADIDLAKWRSLAEN